VNVASATASAIGYPSEILVVTGEKMGDSQIPVEILLNAMLPPP